MAKQGHQQAPDPVDATDLVSKGYADTNYASNQVLAAAGGDYITGYLGTDMTSVTLPQTVLFDTLVSSRGELSLDTTTNIGRISGLKAGRTYFLRAQVLGNGSGGYWGFYWYNVTAADFFEGSRGYNIAANSSGTFGSTPVASTVFTPTEDTEVEVHINSVDDPNDDIRYKFTRFEIIEIGAVQANVVGGLEYLDTITVTGSAVTTVTFGASGDGVHQRALDGDIDHDYMVVGRIVNDDSPTSRDFVLRPNGASTNQDGINWYGTTSSDGSAAVASSIPLVKTGSEEILFKALFSAKTGQMRLLTCDATIANSTGPDAYAVTQTGGVWSDTAANVTSLEIYEANGAIGVGSEITLFRLTRNNLRADSADSYERSVESAVEVGSDTTEQTTGHTAYAGSVVGLTARIEEAVTAGTVTVNLKVDGSTTLSVELNTTDSTSKRGTANIGVHSFGPDKNVSVEIVAASYDNASSITSGITVVATLVNSALIQPPALVGLESNLWVHPETAHEYDDEFESTTLDSAWDLDIAASASAIDPYASFTTGGPRIELHTDRRRSWMMVQPENAATLKVSRAITLPTNFFIWARCTFLTPLTLTNNQSDVGIGLSATDAGNVDSDNRAQVYIDQDIGVNTSRFYVTEGGSGAQVGATTDVDAQGQALTLVGIQKIGSVLHGWVGTDAGSWIYLGSDTYTGAALDRVYLLFISNLTTPGNSIMGIDFIRCVESATFLP